VFSVWYEHHLHIKRLSYPSKRSWRHIDVSCEVWALFTYFLNLNPWQPRTLLQLKLVRILTINLFLT
jgi:hypothetical protein